MVKGADSLQEYEEWEELGDDNGELIRFNTGTVMTGIFLRKVTIELPEDQQTNGQTEADMYVFAHTDNHDNHWSMWATYQIAKITWEEGETYKVACVGERKAANGNVKIWSVKKRHIKKEEAF